MFIRLIENQNFKNTILWIALIAIAWSPHIGLDYVYTEPTGEVHSLTNGQYYFFFVTILSSLILVRKESKKLIRSFFTDQYIVTALGLFFLGFLLSDVKFSNLRLLVIIGLLAICVFFAASIIVNFAERDQNKAVILFMLPYGFPVVAACLLHFVGPLDLGVILENSTHKNYFPERWYFLNSSANGFGLDAAIVCITIYYFLRKQKPVLTTLIFLLLFIASVWVLVQSGTRSAYVFTVVAIGTYEYLISNTRNIKIKLVTVLILITSIIFIYSIEDTLIRLRLVGDLSEITSGRYDGVVDMWKLIIQSPFLGQGFGAADFGLDIYPTNLFYLGMMVEVGIFGAIGAVMLVVYPIFLLFSQRNLRGMLIGSKNIHFPVWAICIVAGFIPYMLFEFSIFRVSSTNQLFGLCLFSSVITLKEQYKKL